MACERPAVRLLPNKVRRGDRERDQRGGPRLPAREQAPLGRREQSRGERDEVERDRVFGEKSDARDCASGQLPARLVVLLGLDDADGDREPGERLRPIRREQYAEDLQRAAAEGCEAR